MVIQGTIARNHDSRECSSCAAETVPRKQEFVNCFCSSSILHETLAQFSTSDNSTANVPDGIAINLDARQTFDQALASMIKLLHLRSELFGGISESPSWRAT